jgi:signal transduction histidine kinase
MTSKIMQLIIENNGNLPDFTDDSDQSEMGFGIKITETTKFESRYFIVKTDKRNRIYSLDVEHIDSITPQNANDYVDTVLSKNEESGRINNYKYLYQDTDSGKIFVFLDCGFQYQIFHSYVTFSVYVSIASLIFVFIFVLLIAKKAISPIANAVEKQKTFITDAGHELKTPLSIINANTDVLELMYEKNEWTESIKNQTQRLNDLIKSMLTLAKLESVRDVEFSDMDISETVTGVTQNFTTIIKAQNKTLETNIAPKVHINGHSDSVKQLMTLLLDNAVKYTSDNGTISVNLYTVGKKVGIDVLNTCDKMPSKSDMENIFRRFYRADTSRSRETGSFGIGLSIAMSIAKLHKGTITAEAADEGTIRFRILLPRE